MEYFLVEGEDEDGPLFAMENAVFEVGTGKFGGNRVTKKPISKPIPPPRRDPDQVFEFNTTQDQAALYRLSGDRNPIHIDPSFAKQGGFSRPILHGLCSLGIAGRLILQHYGNSDPTQFKAIKVGQIIVFIICSHSNEYSFQVRFSKPVYPGDTLQVETWVERNRVYFEAKVKDSAEVAMSGGFVDLVKVSSPSIK